MLMHSSRLLTGFTTLPDLVLTVPSFGFGIVSNPVTFLGETSNVTLDLLLETLSNHLMLSELASLGMVNWFCLNTVMVYRPSRHVFIINAFTGQICHRCTAQIICTTLTFVDVIRITITRQFIGVAPTIDD